jgi:hypothetical protein
MQKKLPKATLIVAVLLVASGCIFPPTGTTSRPVMAVPVPASVGMTTISYFIPTGDKLKFCNGADMDSEGFGKTITERVEKQYYGTFASDEALVNETLAAGADAAGISPNLVRDSKNAYIKLKDKTAYIAPTEGWAGVSIFLCSWKPFVQTNLKQFSFIEKIIWTSAEEWKKL